MYVVVWVDLFVWFGSLRLLVMTIVGCVGDGVGVVLWIFCYFPLWFA